jgi:glycosyltransferase involved in cell wall biosynthesis
MNSKTDISVIISITSLHAYDKIPELYFRYKKGLEKTNLKYEFIYVTDRDSATVNAELNNLLKDGENIKIIQLGRWFGDATALNAGFENAAGRIILTLSSYQQINETDIPKLVESLKDADMVICRRTKRMGNILHNLQAKIFHYLIKLTLGIAYHDLGCYARAFKREVLHNVYIYGDQNRFLPLLANRFGYKVKEIDVQPLHKELSKRVYSIGHYTERLVNLISIFFLIKFTRKPLRFFGFPGILIFTAGFLLALYLFWVRMFGGESLADKPMVLVSILLIVFGIQLFAIGLVAEIIIFTHAKDSKEYIIEEIIDETKSKREEIKKSLEEHI